MTASICKKLSNSTVQIGILLAATGGFLDVYTYLCKGGVFANAQTGNLVLMGISLSKGEGVRALYYLLPVTAFFMGVLVTEYIKSIFSNYRFLQWEHIIILLEIILLFVIGLLPKNIPNAFVNITISFVCSLQVHTFRKLGELPYATTMCTGNLRSAAEYCFHYLIKKEKQAGENAFCYFLIILFFVVGAMSCAWLVALYEEKAVWFCGILLLSVFCIIFQTSKLDKKRHTV